MMNTRIEPIELTADSPRELTDTELDAVSGGAVAVGASSGAVLGGAVASGGTGSFGVVIDSGPFFGQAVGSGPGAAVVIP